MWQTKLFSFLWIVALIGVHSGLNALPTDLYRGVLVGWPVGIQQSWAKDGLFLGQINVDNPYKTASAFVQPSKLSDARKVIDIINMFTALLHGEYEFSPSLTSFALKKILRTQTYGASSVASPGMYTEIPVEFHEAWDALALVVPYWFEFGKGGTYPRLMSFGALNDPSEFAKKHKIFIDQDYDRSKLVLDQRNIRPIALTHHEGGFCRMTIWDPAVKQTVLGFLANIASILGVYVIRVQNPVDCAWLEEVIRSKNCLLRMHYLGGIKTYWTRYSEVTAWPFPISEIESIGCE